MKITKRSMVLIGLTLTFCLSLAAWTEANAATIYGTKSTGEIQRIDTVAQSFTTIGNTGLQNANGNALDSANNRLYFTSFVKGQPSTLYFIDLSAPATVNIAGVLDGTSPLGDGWCSDATFYCGKYYYIGHGTDELNAVTFNPDGTIASQSLVASITTGAKK